MKTWWKRAGMLLTLLVIIYLGVKPDMLVGKPGIKAESAVLMDMNSEKVLMDYNGSEEIAPAGVSKLMTELLVMEAAMRGDIRWNDPVNISRYASSVGEISLRSSRETNLRFRSCSKWWQYTLPMMLRLLWRNISAVQSINLYSG